MGSLKTIKLLPPEICTMSAMQTAAAIKGSCSAGPGACSLCSMQAAPTFKPAILEGGKASLSARAKALSSTRLQAGSLRCVERFPRSIVVFARMAGSSSTWK